MRMKCVLLAFLTTPLLAQVSQVPSSEVKDVVPAFDSAGAITLPAASLKLDILYPNGKNNSTLTAFTIDGKMPSDPRSVKETNSHQ